MKQLSIFVYLTLVSWAHAQDASCVTRQQFPHGEYSSTSKPCNSLLEVPVKYCNAKELNATERLELYIASDLRIYFPPDKRDEASIEEKITQTDLLRISAILDEVNSDSVVEIFYVLYTAILSARLSELADKAGIEEDFMMMRPRHIEIDYFIVPLPNSVPILERMVECAVRCGDVETNMKLLTRSTAFEICVEGE